jgi:hypothetical protein
MEGLRTLSSPILIDNVYRLGRSGSTTPILLKLVRNIDKQRILKKRKEATKLRVFINEDLTPQQQVQKKLLNNYLQTRKAADAEIWGSFRGNSLHIKKAGQVIGRFEVRDGTVQETTHLTF